MASTLSAVPFRASTPTGPAQAADWALLNKTARLSDRRNATTAECHTPEGQPVAVSFWPADPPAVAHLTVHCPGLDASDFDADALPFVLCAEGPLVLLCVTLNAPDWRSVHVFVYSAAGNNGDGNKRPSLRLLPCPDPEVDDVGGHDQDIGARQLGLLPYGDGGSYSVAFLDQDLGKSHGRTRRYHVYVFSSETSTWSRRKAAPLRLSKPDKVLFDGHGRSSCKQVAMGKSSVGWVDLECGILVACNVFDERPVIRFIPFPASSRVRVTDDDYDYQHPSPYYAPEVFCDVVCSGDLIKFVEIDFDEPGPGGRRTTGKGWRATTWCRGVCLEDDWRRRCTVDVDDVSVDGSYSVLLPELLNEETQELELRNLQFLIPTLGVHDDDDADILYMLARGDGGVGDGAATAWVVAVDMRRAVTEAVAPVSTEMLHTVTMYFPCAFPEYLDGDIILALGANMEAETAADDTAKEEDTSGSRQGSDFSDEEDSDSFMQGDDNFCAESYYGPCRYGYYSSEEEYIGEEGEGEGGGGGGGGGGGQATTVIVGVVGLGNPVDNALLFEELPEWIPDFNVGSSRADQRKEKEKNKKPKKKEKEKEKKKSKEKKCRLRNKRQKQEHHQLPQETQVWDDRPELYFLCFFACVVIAIIIKVLA